MDFKENPYFSEKNREAARRSRHSILRGTNMNMPILRLAWVILVCLTLAIAACGGDDQDEASRDSGGGDDDSMSPGDDDSGDDDSGDDDSGDDDSGDDDDFFCDGASCFMICQEVEEFQVWACYCPCESETDCEQFAQENCDLNGLPVQTWELLADCPDCDEICAPQWYPDW